MEWANDEKQEGGCRLMGASVELNARPGELRDYLAEQQIEWIDCIRRMAQKAVSESIFRAGLDTRQFAFEFHSIGLGLNFSLRLLRDPAALSRSQVAFDSLIQKAKS